jgi:hypothetical protein
MISQIQIYTFCTVTHVSKSSTGSTKQSIGLCDLNLLLVDIRIGWFQVIVKSLSYQLMPWNGIDS